MFMILESSYDNNHDNNNNNNNNNINSNKSIPVYFLSF